MAETLDPFGLFGVTLESSLKELKEKYYSLALLCHPDKGGSKEEINMVIKSYNFVKEQLEYKTTKTYEELEQEFTDFCQAQTEIPMPSCTEILDEMFERSLRETTETIYTNDCFRNQGYGHLMDSGPREEKLVTKNTNEFSKDIIIYEEPKPSPYYLDSNLDLTIEKVDDFSSDKMNDYYQAFCEPEKIYQSNIEENVMEQYEKRIKERSLA